MVWGVLVESFETECNRWFRGTLSELKNTVDGMSSETTFFTRSRWICVFPCFLTGGPPFARWPEAPWEHAHGLTEDERVE